MTRLYRAALHLLPRAFRDEYGAGMYDAACWRVADAHGLGRPIAWMSVLVELAATAVRVQLDVLRQDLRATVRTMARAPGFAATVLLVTGLGVGATTAAFTLTDYVLLRPLPFPASQDLVKIWQNQRTRGYSRIELSPGNYRDWRQMSTTVRGMAAYAERSANLSGAGEPQRLSGVAATGELFAVLQRSAALGRVFDERDERADAPATLVLSYQAWQTRFGGDPAIIGRRLLLDGSPHDVIGVMPPDFLFPSRDTDFWQLLRFAPADFEDRGNLYLRVVGRLPGGVTIEQARHDLERVAAGLERQYPDANRDTSATVVHLRDEVSREPRLLITALAGASLCLLLIACTNLAHLLLSRAVGRQRELAVRAAIGAGRERLIRQMLTEGLVMAAFGGLLGVILAVPAVPLLARLVPPALPITAAPAIDVRVLLFAALATGVTGLGFGLLPALRVGGRAEGRHLHSPARAGVSRQTERLRSALVVVEVAASVVLLVVFGLLVRTLWHVQGVDPGFRPEGVLTLRTTLPMPEYASTERRAQFYDEVLAGVERLPGVRRAAYISFLPMVMRGGIWPVEMPDRSSERVDEMVSLRFVTPGFFATIGTPLLRGRDVSAADHVETLPVAVVSQSFGDRLWPGEDPIGRRFTIAFFERTVVGVVGDVRVRGLERESEPQVYLPHRQVPDGGVIFYAPKDMVVRADGQPADLIPDIRRVVASVDATQPVSDARLLSEIVDAETGPRLTQLRVIGVYAAMACLLAAIGLHGLLAFSVSSRAPELAVRLALGAPRRAVVAGVVRRALALAAVGLVLGVAAAILAARLLRALLAGIAADDAPTFALAAGAAALMALVGTALPALRAGRIDPLLAVRSH
jgi:predicted permease